MHQASTLPNLDQVLYIEGKSPDEQKQFPNEILQLQYWPIYSRIFFRY
jgi:hypothetical protein